MTSRKFYGELFGWHVVESSVDGYGMFYLGDRAVAGVLASTGDRAGWLPYVASDDLDTTVDLAVRVGGTVLSPAAELSDAARIAVVADPSGAPLGLWQRRRFAGAQAVNEFATVCWAELATRDTTGAPAFYSSVFGWQGVPAETIAGVSYTEWYRGHRYVAGMTYAPDNAPHWTVNILVESCAGTVALAERLGGQALLAPTEVGAGTYAQIADPHGAGFRVVELVPSLLAAL